MTAYQTFAIIGLIWAAINTAIMVAVLVAVLVAWRNGMIAALGKGERQQKEPDA